jgi:hypothetical protein
VFGALVGLKLECSFVVSLIERRSRFERIVVLEEDVMRLETVSIEHRKDMKVRKLPLETAETGSHS